MMRMSCNKLREQTVHF